MVKDRKVDRKEERSDIKHLRKILDMNDIKEMNNESSEGSLKNKKRGNHKYIYK